MPDVQLRVEVCWIMSGARVQENARVSGGAGSFSRFAAFNDRPVSQKLPTEKQNA
jgi:hypothetical protein